MSLDNIELDIVGSEHQEDQESQINKLLQQTFTNNNYMDQQIQRIISQPLIKQKEKETHEQIEEKNSKASSSIVSEISQIQPYKQDHSMYKSDLSEQDEQLDDNQRKLSEEQTVLQVIEKQQILAYRQKNYADIEKQYKMHLVNQEQKLKLTHNYQKGVPYYVNSHLNTHKIIISGVEVFYQSNTRTFIVWSTLGQIIIYLPSTDKRIQFKPFDSEITSVSISSNMQMIAIASNNMQFAIYRLRQPIRIQDNLTFRLLPKPQLLYKIDYRNLQSNIIQINFLEISNDVECIVLNQFDQISIIKIQKKLLKYKVVIDPLPIAFTTVFMFKSFNLFFANQKYIGLLISSGDAVTLAIIKPKFQLIFVRQQTNRSSIIKQGRIPFIDYCQNKLMVVWDKFVDIIRFELEGDEYKPEYRIYTECHYFFAENSISVGFLSETLIYQFSRTGLRIYSINRFNQGSYTSNKQLPMKQAEIFHEEIALEKIPQVGSLVGEILTNSQPPLTELRYFSQKISCTILHTKNNLNNSLVYAYQDHALESIQFLSYKSFVSKVIDSEGNWRLGLNTLKRIYEGSIYQLDCIRFNKQSPSNTKYMKQFQSLCQDYIVRFVEKTKNIIQVDRGQNHWNTEDIQKQESLFICDFLIRTNKSEFLMDQIVIKMEPEIKCLENLKAFILLKRLKTFGYQNITYYFNHLENQFLSKLIYSLDIQKNEFNEIKSNAIRKKLYLEFVYLCTEEKDFYTPFVILMAKYKQDGDTNLIYLLLYFLKKSISGEKLPLGTYSLTTHKQILKQIILKILTPEVYEQIFKVAPLPLFEQVLPCFFLSQTLPPLNQLQTDYEIREQLSKLKLQNDIIKSLIIGNIPKSLAQVHCKGAYWMFILKIFSRSLVIRINIIEGLYYLTINQLIDNQLVKQIIAKKQTMRQLEQYKNIQDFIERLSSLKYTELQILLLRMARRYIEATKLLLLSASTQNSIFTFLQDIIHFLNPQQLQDLSLIVKGNIKFLAEKDISKLEWLLTTYYSKDQEVFLEVMKPYPELQLSLMSQFLKHKSSENHELRVAYLQLLASLGYKSRVEKQILTSLYPLDQSLEICKKYNILKGQAYIYQRIGDVVKAINTHFLIIKREIEIMDDKSWTDDVMSKTLYTIFKQSMKSCIKICKKFTKRNDYQSEIFWMKIIQGFEGLKLKSTFHHHLICQIINNKVFPQLLQQIISNVQLSSILKYIQQNMKKLQFGTIKLLFILLVKAYSYENQMLHRCQSMVQEGVEDIRQTIIQYYRHGFVSNGICCICNYKQDVVIRYPCGHFIHPYCTTDRKMCEVCSLEDTTFKIKQIIYKQELKFDLVRMIRFEDEGNEVRATRKQKLLDYQFENGIIDEFTKREVIRRRK